MEVSVYDVNNNLLPHANGNTVAFIKSGDIKNYLYNISKPNVALGGAVATQELAINIEKLLNHLGFSNGILKVNINFTRNRIGSDDVNNRAWIQEISATRQEIRIVPLQTKDTKINELNESGFEKLKNLNKDFKYYKRAILNNLTSFQNSFNDTVNTYLETKFGKEFFSILAKDFGITRFAEFRTRIYEDFKVAVGYYLTNKYYNINDSNFGKPSEIRFDDYEQYDFKTIISEIEHILFECINFNSSSLKRRSIDTHGVPKEFKIVELAKQSKNNMENFATITDIKRNVYQPDKVDIKFDDPKYVTPMVEVVHADTSPTKEPIVITPPPKIKTPIIPDSPYYDYSVKNNSATKTILFTYTNSANTTVTKQLSPGATAKLCAKIDTISAGLTDVNSVKSDAINLSSRISAPQLTLSDYSIIKNENCSVVDVQTNSLPKLPDVEPKPIQPIVRPQIGLNENDAVPSTPKLPTSPYEPPKTVTSTPTGTPVIPPKTISTTSTPTTTTTSTGGGCFVEGTLVTLANGAKIAIEEVVIGMEVLTWNEESGQQEAGIVTDLIRPMSSDIISIDLGNESIECTTEHPLFVIGKGWSAYNPIKAKQIHKMEVAELVDGDLVLNSSDETVSINSISPIMTLVPIQTYNLSIEGNHTYYANGILVHNKLDSSGIGGYSGGSGGAIPFDDKTANNHTMPMRGGSTGGGPNRVSTSRD
jgi:hypothetical protein